MLTAACPSRWFRSHFCKRHMIFGIYPAVRPKLCQLSDPRGWWILCDSNSYWRRSAPALVHEEHSRLAAASADLGFIPQIPKFLLLSCAGWVCGCWTSSTPTSGDKDTEDLQELGHREHPLLPHHPHAIRRLLHASHTNFSPCTVQSAPITTQQGHPHLSAADGLRPA